MEMKDLVKDFQIKMPKLVREMKASDHHYSPVHINPYHIESDVWSHSMQVCLLADRFKVNDLVKIAALLHDVGKPLSREKDDEKQKVHFIGHEGISCFKALDFLKTLNLTDQEKVHIMELISYHTALYKMVKPEESVQMDILEKFIGKRKLVEDLISLTMCDALGRFTDKDTSHLEKLDKIILPSLDLLEEKKEREILRPAGSVTVLVGPPNAGKSTWLKTNQKGATILSRDEVILEVSGLDNYDEAYHKVDMGKVDHEFNRRIKEAAAKGGDYIFDMTSMSPKSRRRNFSAFSKNYKRKAVVFYTSYETLMERNEYRSKNLNKTIPQRVMVDMMRSFMAPLYDEVDEVENIFER